VSTAIHCGICDDTGSMSDGTVCPNIADHAARLLYRLKAARDEHRLKAERDELYAALREMVDLALRRREMVDLALRRRQRASTANEFARLAQARAAIAKAEGRS
jgi:hypothetical protein